MRDNDPDKETPPESKPATVTQTSYDPKPEIARIKSTYGNDGFKQMRESLIAGGIVPDIASDKMTADNWKQLIEAIDANFAA